MAEELKAPRVPKRVPKKKVCQFCVEHVEDIDYKDVQKLCAKHQRPLAVAIKRARVMALLPYKAD